MSIVFTKYMSRGIPNLFLIHSAIGTSNSQVAMKLHYDNVMD